MDYSLARFNSARTDPASRVYHLGNGYRAYSPKLARFSAPDNLSPFGGGGINPYAYCVGDPINRADPSGHMSIGQWIGMAAGLIASIALSIVTDGASLPAVTSLIGILTGGAAIGAGSELVAESVDGQHIDWRQVGMAAGIGAGAALAGYGLGRVSRLTNLQNRTFGRLMMSGEGVAENVSGGEAQHIGGQFARPVFFGIYRPEGRIHSAISLSFIDRVENADRLNILGPLAEGADGQNMSMGSGLWTGEHYEPTQLDAHQVANLIQAQRAVNRGIQSVRLAIPDTGRSFNTAGSFRFNVEMNLRERGLFLNVSAPQGGLTPGGPVTDILDDILRELDGGSLGVRGAQRLEPDIFQCSLARIAEIYSETRGAFIIDGF